MDPELERRIAQRASQLAKAYEAGDVAAVESLCEPAFWERAGQEEVPELLADVATVRVLGVLGRRSLILAALRVLGSDERQCPGRGRPVVVGQPER